MNIEDTVDELRRHGSTFTDQLDIVNIPTRYPLVYEQRFTYLQDGLEMTNYTTANTLLLVKNPPYKIGFDKGDFQDQLVNLVSEGDVRPFLLFLMVSLLNGPI